MVHAVTNLGIAMFVHQMADVCVPHLVHKGGNMYLI